MEPPTKRQRFDAPFYPDDEEDQDEISLTPAQFDTFQDPLYQLDKKRAKAATKLKSAYESLFEKYGKDTHSNDDVINFYTDEIEEDNGHIKSLEDARGEPLSSDDEENIEKAKTQGDAPRKPRRPLTSTSPTGGHRPSLFQIPRNTALGMGSYPPPLPFPPPSYSANPAFYFGGSPFSYGHLDPVWQAPDLPPRPPFVHYGPWSRTGASQSAVKRVKSLKFSLRRDLAKTKASNDDAEDDELLLASTEKKTLSTTPSKRPERTSMADPPEVEIVKGVIMKETAKPNNRGAEETEVAPTQSPSRGGNRRPGKSDAPRSVVGANGTPSGEQRTLQAHERRIEVIIPVMRHMLSQEIGGELSSHPPKTAPEGSLAELDPNASGRTSPQEDNAVSQLLDSSQDTEETPLNHDKRSEQHDSSHPKIRKSHKRGRPRTQQQPRFSNASTELELDKPEEMQNEEHQIVEMNESTTYGDTAIGTSSTVEQHSGEDNMDRTAASDQQLPMLSAPEQREARMTWITSTDTSIEPLLAHESAAASPQSAESSGNEQCETIESVDSDTAGPSLLDSATSDQGALQEKSPDACPADHSEDTGYDDEQPYDVDQVLEKPDARETQVPSIETDDPPRSPELPALCDTTENEFPQTLSRHSMFEASHTPEVQSLLSPEKPASIDVPISELYDLRLNSDPVEARRSPSLGATRSLGRAVPSKLVLPLPCSPVGKNKLRSENGNGRSLSPELGTPTRSNRTCSPASRRKASRNPTTPTKARTPRTPKSRGSRPRTPSSRRFPLTSLLPDDIDEGSEDELSMAGSFRSTTSSRAYSPFSRTGSPSLPPLPSTNRGKAHKKNGGLFSRTPSVTPTRISGFDPGEGRRPLLTPATDLRIGRGTRGRPMHNSSPLARTVAERLLMSSPTRRQRHAHSPAASIRSTGSLVTTPQGTLRRCGVDGFTCGRDFCFTCCT